MKRISLKEIASLAGASPSTVSFVLNGKEKEMRISEQLARKIKAVAEREGYIPNQVAVSLRTGQSKVLGLIVESIGGHFFGALARVIEAEADKRGYRIVYCSTENDPVKGKEMIRMLSNSQVDGYLITPVEGMEKDISDLLKHKKPLVLLDGYFPGIPAPYVQVDNAGGVKLGMDHLISRGYRKIAFVTVAIDLVQIKQREQAYKAVLKKNKIPFDKNLVFTLEYNYEKEAGVEKLSDFIKRHPEIDAIFFATNYLGITGLECISRLNLHVPEDLGLVCFDDHDIFGLYPPGISAIAQPVTEIGKSAIRLLLDQLKHKVRDQAGTSVEVPASFIERGST